MGKQTARMLAGRGHTLVMACRNTAAALPVRDEIRRISGNDAVHVMELDLCSEASIRIFVENFRTRFPHLNVLVNNAGIITRYPDYTPDGFDTVIMTNYLGPYLLTRLLIPSLETGAPGRIINLTSGIYPFGTYRWDRINAYRWVKAYAVSKCLVLRATFALAGELQERGITVNAVDPGVINTSIMFTKKWYDALIHLILLPFYVSLEKGAETIAFLAGAGPELDATGHCFYKLGIKRVAQKHRDPKTLRDLTVRTRALLHL
ncbi:MAG: SDR family NAD(P)-dependent oxidoreductase [Candidatus Marinimicrobia bacterium]|nr:SDR family NAD(P)-dependent oxidoreductase [Candidatus Neomarinimicrobiota bacterium]